MNDSLIISKGANRLRRLASLFLKSGLLGITSLSMLIVFFIIFFIGRDAIPFFKLEGFKEFFTSTSWYPAGTPPKFGAMAIFYGSLMVTFGASMVSVPLGISAAVCLSDILPFSVKQIIKPVIEILAALPSVAYGFFAMVILAPLMQNQGPRLFGIVTWIVLVPMGLLISYFARGYLNSRLKDSKNHKLISNMSFFLILLIVLYFISKISSFFRGLTVVSGTNALNVSIILGIMALPTIVSVSEDALNAAGRELRENSYALGATRAETVFKVVIPAASSGIVAAVILGVMRAIGETMVVWMASGNSSQVPEPFYNFLSPIRTLTATIAGDMGEAAHVQGAPRYHVLFAMALMLLLISFISNLISEWAVKRSRKKLRGE